MPFRPPRQYPERIESMSTGPYGTSAAVITVEGLLHSTIGQQERLLHDFDVEVVLEGRREYIDEFPNSTMWNRDFAVRVAPRTHYTEPQRWRFPRGTSIVDMWRMVARHMTPAMLHEVTRRDDELALLIQRVLPVRGPQGARGRRRTGEAELHEQELLDNLIPGRQGIYDRLRAPEYITDEAARRAATETAADRAARAVQNMREARESMGIRGITPNQVIFDEVPPTSRTPEPQGDAMPPEIRQQSWSTLIDGMQQTYTAMANTFTAAGQSVAEAAAFAASPSTEASRAARAAQAAPVLQLQDGESRWFSAVEHLQPAPLARVTSANRFKALYQAPGLINAETSRGLLTTSLFTTEDGPTEDTLRASGKRLSRWLDDTYGVTIHPDAVTAVETLTIHAGRRAVNQVRAEVRRAREDRDNVQAKLDRRIREVNRLLERNRVLEAQLEEPRATPEQEEKARKWDELVAVAAEWNEAPEGDARVRVGKFRLLVHSLKGAASEAPVVAPPVAEDLPMGDEATLRSPRSYAVVA
ncbi:hypothetical protein SEA_WHEELBITE_4 [Arthrobacter phage Wheelbite]|uniref:Uncharacterized protein n=1 Tax=Arthrobacter phage Wheelbite TaxID=2015873 RepID=A0A222ZHA1_9CAUD|nr:hypothetical protein KMD23_gp04 [Arthrobacter phage Wheelbite]ASR84097.1 hypothetical protein SEA_WHEELBITE_4 [Arthrobacter phage Wheelbite]